MPQGMLLEAPRALRFRCYTELPMSPTRHGRRQS